MVFRRSARARAAAVLMAILGTLAVAASPFAPAPVASADPTGGVWAMIDAGQGSSCGVWTDGSAHCWGDDTRGALGNGAGVSATMTQPAPVATPPGVVWASVSSGYGFACGVSTDGFGFCWGDDLIGQVGDGLPRDGAGHPAPVPIAAPTGVRWRSIDAGSAGACGVTTTGAGYCWGQSAAVGGGPSSGVDSAKPVAVLTPQGVSWASIRTDGQTSCGVSTLGVGYCWGDDGYGQVGDGPASNVLKTSPSAVATPAGVLWASIDPGARHTCGVTTTGAGYCWGRDDRGQVGNGTASSASQYAPVPISGGGSWADISAAVDATCGISTTGAASCWGLLSPGAGQAAAPQAVAMPAGVALTTIGVGWGHQCGLVGAGEARCWGSNLSGQLGNGTTDAASQPTLVTSRAASVPQEISFPGPIRAWVGEPIALTASAPSWLPVSFSAAGACGVDGTTLIPTHVGTCTVTAHQPGAGVWAPAPDVARSLPVVASPNAAPQADAGPDRSVASGAAVTLEGAGSDPDDPVTLAWRQTGGPRVVLAGSTTDRPRFLAPMGPATLTFRLTVDDAGVTPTVDDVTVTVQPPPAWRSIVAGNISTCAIAASGVAWCWGSDGYGLLGNGPNLSTTQTVPTPVVAPDGVTWSSITAGGEHACAVATSGVGYCWGRDHRGQVGDGGQSSSATTPVPLATSALRWAMIDAGYDHTCGVTTTGASYCWGNDDDGQLGNGATVANGQPQPVTTPAGTTWASISAGYWTSCGVTTDGDGYCWGNDDLGEVGNGASVTGSQATPSPVAAPAGTSWESIVAGWTHSCGVTTAGDAWCWGSGAWGQLGTGGQITGGPGPNAWAPVAVVGGHEWAMVEPSSEDTCGLTTTGAALCWGRNPAGQAGRGTTAPASVPTPVSAPPESAATISLGSSHTCALATDGSPWCWGSQWGGRLGIGVSSGYATSPLRAGLAQTLSITEVAGGRVGDTRTVTATASSGLEVALVGSDGCVVDGALVTLTAVGTCTLTATQSGDLEWAPATVVRTVTVAPNRAPVAEDLTVATAAGAAVTVGMSGSDPDGDALTYAVVDGPGHGTVTDGTYTPDAGFRGVDTFTYRATDPGGLSSEPRTVTVYVGVTDLTGVVTDEVTGAPIAGAEVRVLDAGDPARTPVRVATLTTDGDGRYATTLPHGTYVVQVLPATTAHIGEWFDGGTNTATATRIVLDASATTATRSVALSPTAGIRGTVRSSRSPGAPIAGLQVRLTRVGATTSQATTTSATGEYAFGPLPVGEYQIWFRDLSGTWISEWYDESATQAASTPVVLTGGTVVVDEQLTPKAAAPLNSGTVSGRITDARTGAPIPGIQVRLYRDPYTGSAATTTDADGRYSFTRLVPGSYKVWFRDLSGRWVSHYGGGASTLAASAPIVVNDNDRVADGALVLKGTPPAPGIVAGTATEADGTTPIAGLQVRLYLDGATGSRATTTAADGSYSFSGLTPGTYRVWFRDLGRTWVSEWHHDAASQAEAAPLAVADGVVLDIDAGLARR